MNKWKPIVEYVLPANILDFGIEVLLFDADGDFNVGYWSGPCKCFVSMDHNLFYPTHFMYLPEPPI